MTIPHDYRALDLARRTFLGQGGISVGALALAGLLPGQGQAAPGKPADSLAPRLPHFAPRAKRVIHLFMTGAPSQLDLFDNKPMLTAMEGKPLPPSVIAGQRYAFIRPDAAVLGPRFKFKRHGQSGAEISEVMPHTAAVAVA